MDLTPLAAHQPLRQHAYNSVRLVEEEVGASDDMLEGEDDGSIQEDAGWSDDEIDFMMVAITADREKSVASQRLSSRLRRRVLRVHQPRRCTKNNAVHSSKKNMLTMKPFSIILVINLPSSTANFARERPPRK